MKDRRIFAGLALVACAALVFVASDAYAAHAISAAASPLSDLFSIANIAAFGAVAADLRGKRGKAVDDIAALAEKMNADDYVEDKADQPAYDALKKDIAGFDAKITRAEDAARLKASVAVIVPPTQQVDAPTAKVFAQPLIRYSKLKSFKDVTNERGIIVRAEEQAYRTGQFLLATMYNVPEAAEWCKNNGIMIQRAQSEGVNSAGGFLVPEEMMNSIIDLRETFGVMRREAQIVPMGRDTMNWPRRTGGTTGYFVAENTAPTESTATWDSVNLTAKKLASLVRISTEVAEDAIINIADWITKEIAYGFASKEDDCGFNGDATSTYGGMTGVCATGKIGAGGLFTATGHATFDVITAADIEGMRALLPFYALPNAKIYCSQYAFALCFERLVAAGGGNSIATLNGEVQYRYLGTPIVICQKMVSTTPTGLIGILYGDMAKAVAFGERRQVSIKRSDDRYFDTDQIGIMGTERFDINAHDVGNATTAGPLVALKMG